MRTPADRVLCGGPVRVDVYVGSGAERSVRMVNTDGGRRVDAESGHGAIKRPGPLVRQIRRGEERAGLQTVQLRCARQYVTYQEHPQVPQADPGVAGRQVDADAQQMTAYGGNLHEVAGTGVDDTQHDAEASRGNRRHRGGPDRAPDIGKALGETCPMRALSGGQQRSTRVRQSPRHTSPDSRYVQVRGHINTLGSGDSQAYRAGSIPVIRSSAKPQASGPGLRRSPDALWT